MLKFVTWLTQDNVQLLEQLESDLKGTINWNKYQSKVIQQTRNRNLDFLLDTNFQGVNRLFVLSIRRQESSRNLQTVFSSNCRNKRLQYCNWWKKFFSSTSKKQFKNI